MLTPLLSLLSPAGPRGRLSTLIFHRVLRQRDPLFPGEVTQHDFDAICGWVKQWFNVLPLDAAVQMLRQGRLPSRALAITFDDGYADNHDLALPVLQRHGLSACFFIATGFLDGGRMWNDTVIETVRRIPGPTVRLGLAGIDELDVSDAAARGESARKVLSAFKHLPFDDRAAAVEAISSRFEYALPDDLMMRSDQVRSLRRAGMVIGAHTVHHPILLTVGDDRARREMAESRSRLEELIGEPVDLFAYPNGRPGQDFDGRHVVLARELGFRAAVTTAAGVARQGTDPMQIPRFTPWDRTAPRFMLRLTQNMMHASYVDL